MEADFVVSYYDDIYGGLLNCEQHLAGVGEATFGLETVGACPDCTGILDMAADAWVDVTDPALDPDHCDIAVVDAYGLNYGDMFITPVEEGGFGDANRFIVKSYGSWEEAGTDYSGASDGTLTAAAIAETMIDGVGLEGAVFNEAFPGSLAEAVAEAGLFAQEGSGGQYTLFGATTYAVDAQPLIDPLTPQMEEGEYLFEGYVFFNLGF